jgi:hypothetical protein
MRLAQYSLLTLILLVYLTAIAMPANSYLTAIVSANPETETPFSQDIFTVTINVVNVTNLNSWQIGLRFNPNILNCTAVKIPQENIFANYTTFDPLPIIDNGKGLVVKFQAIASSVEVNGSGILCQIEFKALTPGFSYLNFTEKNVIFNGTYLQDYVGTFIPFETINATVNVSPPEKLLTVPFHYQNKSYYSGPASLEMVFHHYGQDIPQIEIAEVARTTQNGTYPDELRRAGHFSNISTSTGSEISGNISGYSLRQYGYGSFEKYGLTLYQLKDVVRKGYPVIVLTWYNLSKMAPHYRVVVGYNATHIILHDPWNKTAWGGEYGGQYLALNYTEFLQLWNYSNYWGLFVHPWILLVEAHIVEPDLYHIIANITYPVPTVFMNETYAASSAKITINLPAGTSLTQGSNPQLLDSGTFNPGASTQVNWTVRIDSPGLYSITVKASGTISGNVSSHGTLPNYTYQDELSIEKSVTLELWWANEFNTTKSGQNYLVTVFSNSTINAFNFNETSEEISFNATGPDGTTGSCLVAIPKALLNRTYFRVFADSVPVSSITNENATHKFISFKYLHSTKQIRIATPGPGDINEDGKVDILDVAVAAYAFGSYPGHPRWNPIADINGDNKIDIVDVAFIAWYYGSEY